MGTTTREITGLLRAWSRGDRTALEDLVPLVERELRQIARRCLERERSGITLQTTAVVNEAYVRLIDAGQVNWQDRAHFFAVCSQIMRHILVDHARARRTAKRGGGAQALPLNEAMAVSQDRAEDVVAIDEALESLSRLDPRKGQVVELRFFGGLSVEETAEVLHISPESVMRDWRLAKGWLLRELSREEQGGSGRVAAT
jgi:RNA polymerase sigma-70 factor, ECF subfamily